MTAEDGAVNSDLEIKIMIHVIRKVDTYRHQAPGLAMTQKRCLKGWDVSLPTLCARWCTPAIVLSARQEFAAGDATDYGG